MIGKATTGSGFKGLVKYLYNGKDGERVEWSEGVNIFTVDPEVVPVLMRQTANMNERVKKPVYHLSLSFAHEDNIGKEEMLSIAKRTLQDIGLGDHQALIVAHSDTEHKHVHIVVNRVNEDGYVWDNKWDYRKIEKSLRMQERLLGLREVSGIHFQTDSQAKALHADLTSREIKERDRLGRDLLAERVGAFARDKLLVAFSWKEAHEILGECGYEFKRKGQGLVVTDGKRDVKASRIDRKLSLKHLEKLYGEYIAVRPEGAFTASELLEKLASQTAAFTESEISRFIIKHIRDDKSRGKVLSAIMSSGDIVEASLKDKQGMAVYGYRPYIEVENRMFATAEKLAKGRKHSVLRRKIEDLISSAVDRASMPQEEWGDKPLLSQKQGAALVDIMEKQGDIAALIGKAGTGKTTLLRAAVNLYRSSGYNVCGAALSGIAAKNLGQETGISSFTIASLKKRLEVESDTVSLGKKSVLIVDEAGMVDTRTMEYLTNLADKRGLKLILVGDDMQLPAITAGAAFRGILGRITPASISEVWRQRESWQKEATELMGDGNISAALDIFADQGAIRWKEDRSDAITSLVKKYVMDIEVNPGKSRIVSAHTNRDVDVLNRSIRKELVLAGRIKDSRLFNTDRGQREFGAGDRIIFLKNEYNNLDVRNGTTGTIKKIWGESLHVDLDDGRKIAVSTLTYRSFAHGYASTIHKSQGITVDHSYFFAGGTLSSELVYVAMSRGRERNDIYASKDKFSDVDALKKMLSRGINKKLFSDYSSEASLSYRQLKAPEIKGDYPSVEAAFEALEPRVKSYLAAKETLAQMDLALEQSVIKEKSAIEAERDIPAEEANRVAMLSELKDMSRNIFRDPDKILEMLGEEDIKGKLKVMDIDSELLGANYLGVKSKSRKAAKSNLYHLKQLAASIDRKMMHLNEDKAGIIGNKDSSKKWRSDYEDLGGEKQHLLLKDGQIQTEEALRQVFEKFGDEAIKKFNHPELNKALGVQKLGHSLRLRLKIDEEG